MELAQIFTQAYPPFIEKGFTVFAVSHGSTSRYPMSSIVADMRRSVRFIRQHAKESLIVHGDADMAVPMDQGETMHAALAKAGVPASFIRIKGAGRGFEGAAPADLERR